MRHFWKLLGIHDYLAFIYYQYLVCILNNVSRFEETRNEFHSPTPVRGLVPSQHNCRARMSTGQRGFQDYLLTKHTLIIVYTSIIKNIVAFRIGQAVFDLEGNWCPNSKDTN